MNAASSTYRRNKQQEVRTRGAATTKPRPDPKPGHTFDPTALCRFCAERGHGKNPPWGTRRSQCPAYGKRCGKCKNVNHIERACLGMAYARRPTETTETSDEQSAAFELCTMVNGPVANVNAIALHHHLYDNLCDRWHKRTSAPQPYVPGMKNKAADAMSRRPTGRPVKTDLPDDHASLSNIDRTHEPDDADSELLTHRDATGILGSVTWDRVREATASNPNMRLLPELIEDGMPKTRNEMPVSIRQFHQCRRELSTTDGVAIYKDRVIIPPALRHAVLAALHAAHQGVSMMTARAETSIFWPGMTEDIAKVHNECDHCHRMAPSQPAAPPTQPILPVYPFQAICSDFFSYKGV